MKRSAKDQREGEAMGRVPASNRRRWGRGSLRLFQRVRELFPLTLLGTLVAAASAFALFRWAYGEQDIVLLVIGYGALALCSASLIFVGIGVLRMLWVLRAKSALESAEPVEIRAETGRFWETGFSVPGLVFFPLLQVHLEWSRDTAELTHRASRGELREQVQLTRRGSIRRVNRAIRIGDAFGLAAVTIRREYAVAYSILPHLGRLKRVDLLPSFAGGDEWPHPLGVDDGDRVELRRYTPGDPARFLHWKVFARTRRLMIRVPERALSRARRTVAYLVAGEGDAASSAAARMAIQEDTLGPDWAFGADGTAGVLSNARLALDAIAASGNGDFTSAHGLANFVQECERSGPVSVVVFVPARAGAWLEAVQRLAATRRGGLRVVVGVDGLEKWRPVPFWQRILWGRPLRASGDDPSREIEGLLAQLSSMGCDAVLVDRLTGRRLGGAHLRAPNRERGRAA